MTLGTKIKWAAIVLVPLMGWVSAQLDEKKTSRPEPPRQLTPAEARKKMIEKAFSPWDGSHIQLERLIKKIHCMIRILMSTSKPFARTAKTTSWCAQNSEVKNAFGGVVLNQIKAECSLDGKVIRLIE